MILHCFCLFFLPPSYIYRTLAEGFLRGKLEKCQTPLMDGEQMNVLRRSAADKYRKQYNLLISEEIIKCRASLGMSQTAFANYLKVGEESIKRWETYFVQDVVQDDHIRLKCNEA